MPLNSPPPHTSGRPTSGKRKYTLIPVGLNSFIGLAAWPIPAKPVACLSVGLLVEVS